VAFGPPAVSKPIRELRAELLLKAGHAAEAKLEFTRALAAYPGRSRSLLGLARAALAAGDSTVARDAVRQLTANWHAADANLPDRQELARLASRFRE
jgi:predicted Zn-dependent protease